MNKIVAQFGPVVGRCLVALIFLLSGLGKIFNFSGTAGYMAAKGIPLTEIVLVVTILIEVGGSAMLILGWKARLAAVALFLWMIPVTLTFHNFWAMAGQEQMINQIMFLKNLSIMGAMLYIMAFGSGRYSLRKD